MSQGSKLNFATFLSPDLLLPGPGYVMICDKEF